MNADPNQVKAIFLEAIERHAPGQWPAFLDQACGGQPELRRRVEVLLEAHQEAGTADHRAEEASPRPVSDGAEQAGSVIGPYKLLQEIGEGGMGTVWLAQQQEPVKRLVALKLIKAGMDSKQVLARFEAERQALALMDHPNIARVFDAGTTATGRPYFVMERVLGVSITRFCDEQRLTPRQRLELFVSVCQAVQHAHQKGIIHRDLKPSNVLIALYDGKAVPKVIDFGIAKATEGQLTDKTLVTGFGSLVGTLEYMSPEQAELNQLDVDIRSDVYSLGVLLYELLTGTTPLEKKRLKEAAMLEVLRLIREEEPPRPSTRLSESRDSLPAVSAQRQSEPAKLTKLVRGELDWIVMKALDKDRNRRYESANGFALDVQRYLANEPVQAGPASAWYRLRKVVRRHRGPVLATGVVVAGLLAGVAVSTWQAVRATRSEATARRSAQTTQAINRYLIEDLFAAATPGQAQGRKITVEEVLDRAAVKIDTAFPDQPEVEAGVRLAIGQTYLRLSLYAKAEPHLRRALELRRGHLGADHADTLEAMKQVGWLCAYQGNYDEAEHHHRQVLDGLRRVGGKEHRGTLQQLHNLAWVLAERHQHERAEPLFREGLAVQLRVLGEEDPDTLATMDKLAQVLSHQRRWPEAAPLARRCLEIKRRVLGENDPETLDARRTVALALQAKGAWVEAERLYRENLAAARRVFPANHRETLLYLSEVGWLSLLLGRFSDAEREFRASRDGFVRVVGADHEFSLGASGRLALALLACGRAEEAQRQAGETLQAWRRVRGPAHPTTLGSLACLGKVLRVRGRWTEAEICLRQAVEGFRDVKGADNDHMWPKLLHEQAAVLLALGRREEARRLLWQVLEGRRRELPADHPDLAASLRSCGEYLLEVGQAQQARSLLAEAVRIQRKALPPGHPAIGESLVALGWARTGAGAAAQGERLLREGLATARKGLPTGHWFPADAESRLGGCLVSLKRFDEAQPLLLGGCRKLLAAAGTPPARRLQALERLVHYYDLRGQPEEAAAWRLKLRAEKKPGP